MKKVVASEIFKGLKKTNLLETSQSRWKPCIRDRSPNTL